MSCTLQIQSEFSQSNMENVNQDELILKQQEAIQKDIASSTSLVSGVLPLHQLETEFQADEVFRAKILKLQDKYSHLRRVRPDGNCFFRAVGFRLFEQLLGSAEQLARVRARVEPSKEQMVGLGMPEFTVEDFYDNFMESLGQLGGEDKVAAAELDTMFNDEGVSNYLVVFLRWGSLSTSTPKFKLTLYHSQVTDQQTVAARGGILPELHGGRPHRGRVLQHRGGAHVQGERPHPHHRSGAQDK